MTVIEAIDKLTKTVQRLDRQVSQLQAGAKGRPAHAGSGMTATAPAPIMERPHGRMSEARMRAEFEAAERVMASLGKKSARDMNDDDLTVMCSAMSAAGAEVAEAEARRADRRHPRLAKARAMLRKMIR